MVNSLPWSHSIVSLMSLIYSRIILLDCLLNPLFTVLSSRLLLSPPLPVSEFELFCLLCDVFFSQTINWIWKRGPNCPFLIIDLVVHCSQGARPNYVAFVLVIPDTYFWLRASSLWLTVLLARAVQLVENAHKDTSYDRTQWLNWKKYSIWPACGHLGMEKPLWEHTCNLWPHFCAHPAGMEEAVVCSSQRPSDRRPRRVGVLQEWPCQEAHSCDWPQLMWTGMLPFYFCPVVLLHKLYKLLPSWIDPGLHDVTLMYLDEYLHNIQDEFNCP